MSPFTPAIAEITSRNQRQLLQRLVVKRRPSGGAVIYGMTAARGQSTEFTGFLILTRKAIAPLILDLQKILEE